MTLRSVDGALTGHTKGADGARCRRGQTVRWVHRLSRLAAAHRRATSEEVAEALGVALLMDGGTASVYGPRAWEAFHEFVAAVPSSHRVQTS